MSTTEIGRRAEAAAAHFLKSRGFIIVERNWRTRFHEVDIVARKGSVTHFVEVKYRKSDRFGTGLEYVSQDKLHRLKRAALYWQQTRSEGAYQFDAVTITGSGPYRLHYEPNLTG